MGGGAESAPPPPPILNRVKQFQLVNLPTKTDMTNPCRPRSIPTLSNLLQWQVELRRANLAMGNFVIEYSSYRIEHYDIEAVFDAQKLQYARQIKQAVTKEVEWFASTISVPKSIHQRLPTASVNAFRSLVHDHGYLDKLPSLEMTSDELARVVWVAISFVHT